MTDQEVPASDLPQNQQPQGQEVPSSDLPQQAMEVPSEDIPNQPGPDSLGREIGAGVEGVAQGFAGPIATAAELGLSKLGVPGLSAEEIAQRQKDFPLIHGVGEAAGLIGGQFTGIGELGLISKGLEGLKAAENAARWSKIGSAAIKASLEGAAISASDEATKGLLGQGDPAHPVASVIAHIGSGGAWGLLGGALAESLINPVASARKFAANELANAKIGEKALEIKTGLGKALSSTPEELLNPETTQNLSPLARHAFNAYAKIPETAVRTKLDLLGFDKFGYPGALLTDKIAKWMSPTISKYAFNISQKFSPVLAKVLSSDSVGNIVNSLNFAKLSQEGGQHIDSAVRGIFEKGSPYISGLGSKFIDKLRDFIDNGGVDSQLQQAAMQPQSFAEGGEVQPMNIPQGGIAEHFPEQNSLLHAARLRVSNYLTSMKPSEQSIRLPYDIHRNDKEHERLYERTLDLANNPLTVVNHIRQGNLLPQHVKAFNSMYPELHNLMTQKILQHVAGQVHDEEKPSSKVRQSLSLFLGQPLESSLTPQNMIAAQSAFIQPMPSQQAQVNSAKKTSSLPKIAKSAMTPDQSREERLAKS